MQDHERPLRLPRSNIIPGQIDLSLQMGVRETYLALSRGRLLALLLGSRPLWHDCFSGGCLQTLVRELLEQIDVVWDLKGVPEVEEL